MEDTCLKGECININFVLEKIMYLFSAFWLRLKWYFFLLRLKVKWRKRCSDVHIQKWVRICSIFWSFSVCFYFSLFYFAVLHYWHNNKWLIFSHLHHQLIIFCCLFYRAMRMNTAHYTVAKCPTIRHTPILCWNWKHIIELFSPSGSHTILLFIAR